MLYFPLIHGSVGFLDEALVYCLPLVVVILIIVRTMRRAASSNVERERSRDQAQTAHPEENKSDQGRP